MFTRILAAAVLVVSWYAGVSAQPAHPTDSDVKAIYLYNFSRFTTWQPARPEDGVTHVCVIGRDPFGAALDRAFAGESSDETRFVARRLEKPEDALACRILFVGDSEQKDWPRILQVIGTASILTVSDMPDFTSRGGMIQFVTRDNRVRFEVNLSAAEQAHIALSSELLKVATAVRRGRR